MLTDYLVAVIKCVFRTSRPPATGGYTFSHTYIPTNGWARAHAHVHLLSGYMNVMWMANVYMMMCAEHDMAVLPAEQRATQSISRDMVEQQRANCPTATVKC